MAPTSKRNAEMIEREARSSAISAMSRVALKYRTTLSPQCLAEMLNAALSEIAMTPPFPSGLSKRQNDALNFIRSYAAENDGISPSFDDIREGLNLKSRSSVSRLVAELEQRGAIKRGGGFGRNIVLTNKDSRR